MRAFRSGAEALRFAHVKAATARAPVTLVAILDPHPRRRARRLALVKPEAR